jgi:hypothetical protein
LALVVDTGSYGIRVCYQGLANFADDDASVTASYIGGGLSTGSVYFLSDGGQLTLTEPVSSSQVTKPMMVAITPSSGIIINSRGIRLAPNYTTSSNTLSGYMTAGSGSFSASLSKPPAYLRTVLICESGGDLSYNQYDEVDSQCVFATGSGGLCVPFLTTTCNVTSYTASFKHTSSWAPHMSCLSGSGATGIGKINLTKWKLKIYS